MTRRMTCAISQLTRAFPRMNTIFSPLSDYCAMCISHNPYQQMKMRLWGLIFEDCVVFYFRVSNNRTPSVKRRQGKTPFHMACKEGQFKAFNSNFVRNQPVKIRLELEEIEKL